MVGAGVAEIAQESRRSLDRARILPNRILPGQLRPGRNRARASCHPRRTSHRPGRRLSAPGPDLGRASETEGTESVYEDRTLTCRDCGEAFIFSAGEQRFFAEKSLTNEPQRCLDCRAAAKQARTGGGPRQYHAAVCGACGNQAMVPFAPRSDRPVYCSTCFDKVRAGLISPPSAPANA